MEWPQAIELMTPSIVKIETPRGSGTGFVIASSKTNGLCGIATAGHVIAASHYWEEPIRIHHILTGTTKVFRPDERVILVDQSLDTAVLLIARGDPFVQDQAVPLTPEGLMLKIGNEVGWLGFPSVSPNSLCFFTGRASFYDTNNGAYLIDGVVINGVSGGPVFHLTEHFPVTVGVVSAYLVNRATGETLPGLGVVRDVRQFQALIKQFKSLEEAKQQETTPSSPPPPQPALIPPPEGAAARKL